MTRLRSTSFRLRMEPHVKAMLQAYAATRRQSLAAMMTAAAVMHAEANDRKKEAAGRLLASKHADLTAKDRDRLFRILKTEPKRPNKGKK